jgi:hypothetical protein
MLNPMSLFAFTKTTDIELPIDASLDFVTLKFITFLNQFNYRTISGTNKISFRKKITHWKQNGENRSDFLSIFREGELYLLKVDNNLKIRWLIKLNVLYFISILIAICLVGFVWIFYNPTMFYLILLGLITLLISLTVGVLIILNKIIEINKTCLSE